MAGYTRQDTADNIADTKTIDAADLDAEFDAVEAAFNNSTGHSHDGTAAEGAPIEVTGPNQEYLSEAAQFRPKTDDTYDLGSATFQWKDLYVDGVANIDSLVADTADIDAGTIDNTAIGGTTPAAGSFTNVTVSGTVDGRDVAADGTKLDGIEAGADVTDTTNVTAAGALMDSELANIAAVKALDQGVATTDSPTFAGLTVGVTDLSGVEANADVTDTANVTAAGALMDSELTNIAAVKALDQGVATTDSPTFAGLTVGSTDLSGVEANADVTDTVNVTAAGALMDSELTNIAAVKALDQGVATTDSPTFAGLTVTGNVDGRDVSADGTKLDTIETNADVTDTANVTAAGALMDSELTDIASVKALNQGVATTDSPTFAGLTLSGTLNFDSGDFSAGSVTPTITGGSSAPSAVTYSGQAGRYIRVGNLIFVHLYLGVTSITGGSGIGVIGGLPGTPSFTGITSYSANVGFASGHGSAVVRTALFTQASGGIVLYNASNTAINLSDYASSDVYISIFYEVS